MLHWRPLPLVERRLFDEWLPRTPMKHRPSQCQFVFALTHQFFDLSTVDFCLQFLHIRLRLDYVESFFNNQLTQNRCPLSNLVQFNTLLNARFSEVTGLLEEVGFKPIKTVLCRWILEDFDNNKQLKNSVESPLHHPLERVSPTTVHLFKTFNTADL